MVEVETGDANDETQGSDQRCGPSRVVSEKLGVLVGHDFGVGAVGGEFRRVKFFANGQSAEGVFSGPARSADLEVPEFLTFQRKDKGDEFLCDGAVRGSPQEAYGIDSDGGTSCGSEVLESRGGGADFHRLALEATIKINAHSDGGITE